MAACEVQDIAGDDGDPIIGAIAPGEGIRQPGVLLDGEDAEAVGEETGRDRPVTGADLEDEVSWREG